MSNKADKKKQKKTKKTLVSRSMQHGRRATLHNGTRVREATARVAAGDHNGLAVVGRYMCGKRRRRHRFSAFWLRSSVACVTSFFRLHVFSLFPACILSLGR